MHVHTHTHMHARMHAHTHIYMHIHIVNTFMYTQQVYTHTRLAQYGGKHT